MVRTSTSVRRTSTIMKSTAGAFVATNSCSPSVDMLGGCERGCGNDRAHAGVGFGIVSIQFEGKKKVNPHLANASHLFGLTRQIHQIRQIRQIRRITLRLSAIFLSPSFYHHHALAISVSEKNWSVW